MDGWGAPAASDGGGSSSEQGETGAPVMDFDREKVGELRYDMGKVVRALDRTEEVGGKLLHGGGHGGGDCERVLLILQANPRN